MKLGFELKKVSKKSRARAGVLHTAHGSVQTPFFLPIATKAAIKGLEVSDVTKLGAEMILSNTYHLYLQPGVKILQKFGGLHKFMQSSVPILTDSGGFQIFSLGHMAKLTDDGVIFRSHLNGDLHTLTPKKAMEIQAIIGSDVMMVLDYFPGYPATRKQAKRSIDLTKRWATLCQEHKKKLEKRNKKVGKQLLFAIVQGSTFEDLRLQSAKDLAAMKFDGYAVGGLAVGEPAKEMYKVLDYIVPALPAEKIHYLMGVGYPDNIVEAVKRGIDMFDCVIPTREARHGRLFYYSAHRRDKSRSRLTRRPVPTSGFRGRFWSSINIRSFKFKNDISPVNQTTLKNYSKAYLHHLFRSNEMLGLRLASLHNLEFYQQLMMDIRLNIKKGDL